MSNSDGNPVLNTKGEPIIISTEYSASELEINEQGELCYPDASGVAIPIDQKIAIAQFNNPAGISKGPNSLNFETEASGEALLEDANTNLSQSKIRQRYLEASNVQAVDEMVNLIVAQRAYEMNSKIITASDEMLQQANNLR